MKFSGLLVAAGFCSTLRFLRVVLLFNLFAATAAVEFRMDGVHTIPCCAHPVLICKEPDLLFRSEKLLFQSCHRMMQSRH